MTQGYELVTTGAARIMMNQRPRITGPSTQTGVPGDIIDVVCEAESAPTPTGVIWTFLGRTILTGRININALACTKA